MAFDPRSEFSRASELDRCPDPEEAERRHFLMSWKKKEWYHREQLRTRKSIFLNTINNEEVAQGQQRGK
jgi:hypothetical protein